MASKNTNKKTTQSPALNAPTSTKKTEKLEAPQQSEPRNQAIGLTIVGIGALAGAWNAFFLTRWLPIPAYI
jgi:hypothetical protein